MRYLFFTLILAIAFAGCQSKKVSVLKDTPNLSPNENAKYYAGVLKSHYSPLPKQIAKEVVLDKVFTYENSVISEYKLLSIPKNSKQTNEYKEYLAFMHLQNTCEDEFWQKALADGVVNTNVYFYQGKEFFGISISDQICQNLQNSLQKNSNKGKN
ncbi:MAG: hypothetical protein MR902_05980 [Campylobacter sp.]|nr:hypothetical protein [Campylobacter sp.]